VLPERYGTGMFIEAHNTRDILRSPLAKMIFKEIGIKSVFFGKDFITVTKTADESWVTLKSMMFSRIMDFYAEELPVINDETTTVSDTTILDTDDEIVATIKELIETRVRPSVQEDGGDIFYKGFI
jgi:hypothetical protein